MCTWYTIPVLIVCRLVVVFGIRWCLLDLFTQA